MRTAFLETLLRLAEEDDRVELLVGDLGFGVVEPFAERFPDRFCNVGVAEQNMTGIATGLALTGSVVVTYSIGNFPTLRCLEQIRNDACYHGANVKIVAVGGGLAYGALGPSHHATEDLAVMRAIPNLAVVAPADPAEAASATRHALRMEGAVYLRLGKAGEARIHPGEVDIPPGSSLVVRPGEEVVVLACGSILGVAVAAAEALDQRGIDVSVVSLPWIDPIDVGRILAVGASARLVVTLEEHSVIGGLGGAVAEILASVGTSAPLLRLGLPHAFTSIVGSQEYLRTVYGLDAPAVAAAIASALSQPQEDQT